MKMLAEMTDEEVLHYADESWSREEETQYSDELARRNITYEIRTESAEKATHDQFNRPVRRVTGNIDPILH